MTMKKTNAADRLDPVRIILTPAEVTAAFILLGRSPPPAPLFAGLPVHDGGEHRRLVDARGKLRPELKAMFDILAEPAAAMGIETIVPGNEAIIDMRVMWGRASPLYLIVARTADGDWDLALLTAADQLLALLDELLGLTRVVSRDGAGSFDLSMPALAVLAAFGDLIQEEDLERRLARSTLLPLRPVEPISPDELVRMAERGLESADTRWGVTLVELLSGGALSRCTDRGALDQGLDDLAELGLVSEDRVAGIEAVGLARILTAPTLAAAITIASAADGAILDRIAILRTPLGLLSGLWRDEGVTLAEMSARTLVAIFGDSVALPGERPAGETRETPAEATAD